jgi:hypothetical protein
MAHHVYDLKSLGDRYVTPVKDGMSRGRFLMLAACTSSGIRRLSFAIIGIAAFPAGESTGPFLIRNKFQTMFVGGKFRNVNLSKL